jgi:2-methylcitrate dehydratase PrpD
MHGTLPWDARFRALLSTPYSTSVILHDRACWIDQFTAERIADPAIGAFARDRVKVVRDPKISGTAATVEMTMRDGRELKEHREVPKGDALDPLSRTEIEAKLRRAAEDRLLPGAVDSILETVSGLESASSVAQLLAALDGSGQSSRHPTPASGSARRG